MVSDSIFKFKVLPGNEGSKSSPEVFVHPRVEPEVHVRVEDLEHVVHTKHTKVQGSELFESSLKVHIFFKFALSFRKIISLQLKNIDKFNYDESCAFFTIGSVRVE